MPMVQDILEGNQRHICVNIALMRPQMQRTISTQKPENSKRTNTQKEFQNVQMVLYAFHHWIM